jgi:hypothetical protein
MDYEPKRIASLPALKRGWEESSSITDDSYSRLSPGVYATSGCPMRKGKRTTLIIVDGQRGVRAITSLTKKQMKEFLEPVHA